MEPRNFEDDLKKSNNPVLRENWIKMFKYKFGEDIEVIWKDDVATQKGFGTDVVIKDKKGRRYSVEVKTRNKSCFNKDWIMEIFHVVYNNPNKDIFLYKEEGWVYSTTAEYIFHATLDDDGTTIIECIFYSLMPFKNEKWKGEFKKYPSMWLSTRHLNGNFRLTYYNIIPENIIKQDAVEFWRWENEIIYTKNNY